LEEQISDSKPTTQICPHLAQIKEACKGVDLNLIAHRIMAMEDSSPWIARAREPFSSGCPITAHIGFLQVKEYHRFPLADCF
ncbi:hypothetical protein OFN63_38630, partial [Escherichia coli]|nr:hypothetical protein [Escherichia coli]